MGNIRNTIAWLSATLFFAYQFILRVMPNVMLDDIITKFQITPGLVGHIAGFYYIAYTLMHIPVGILLDHLGPKRIIPLCAILTVAGILPLVYSDSWVLLMLGRILVGGASSAGVLGVFKVIRMFYPAEKFTFMFGISVMLGLLGAIYGGQPLTYIMTQVGWNNTINILAVAGVIIAAITYFSISHEQEKVIHEPILDDLKLLFSHKRWLVISILGGLMIGPLEGFADGWASTYFLAYDPLLTKEMATFLPSLIFLGMAFGSPVIGLLASKTGAYYAILTSCSVAMLGSFILLLYFNLSITALIIILIIAGVACSYQNLIIYLASTFVPVGVSGITASCANMIMMVFGYFFHVIISSFISSESLGQKDILISALSIIPYTLAAATVGLLVFLVVSTREQKAGS